MEKSKVYFTDFRTPHSGMSIPQKLQKLIKKAGIGDINFEKQFAAIKIHFGEPGNISYLRPNFAKAVVDVIKELGTCATLATTCKWISHNVDLRLFLRLLFPEQNRRFLIRKNGP